MCCRTSGRSPWLVVLLLGSVTAFGCSDDDGADTQNDAAIGVDAGATDGGPDTGTTPEAGVDAGPMTDAGPQPPTPVCDGSWGTTYYVRPDGGDANQCTGLADAAYPGSGTQQPCAFNHPFVALPPGGTAILQGGDRLIIKSGSYEMGYNATTDVFGDCDSSYAWDCRLPNLPSGADAAHPTCIVGEGFDQGCPIGTRPELYAVQRSAAVLDLTGASHVRVECLELTDHSQCVSFHSGAIECPNRDTYPHGDYGAVGVQAADSADVTLRHLDAHGFPDVGVRAVRLTDWTLEHVRISGNGWAGWDGDDGSGNSSNSGTLRFSDVEISWNGCGETYPSGQPVGCWAQSAGGYGDGLGTDTTGGDWIFEDCRFLHNTSDGLDLLYLDETGTVTIRRLRSEGNAGNQVKVAGDAEIVNSVLVGNCGYFDGQPFTFNVDNCRALGNTLELDYHPGAQVTLVNSTLYGEGDILVSVGGDCAGGESLVARNNVFIGDVELLDPTDTTVLFYQEGCGGLVFDADYSIVHGARGNAQADCPVGTNDLCQDPMVVGPLSGDAYGLALDVGSPALDNGLGVGAQGLIPADDFLGVTRPQGAGVDRGAYERVP